MIYLALVLWPLGDVERARQFADRAVTQAAKSGNLQTLVYVTTTFAFSKQCGVTGSAPFRWPRPYST